MLRTSGRGALRALRFGDSLISTQLCNPAGQAALRVLGQIPDTESVDRANPGPIPTWHAAIGAYRAMSAQPAMDADPLDVQAEPTTPSKVQPHPSQHSALPAEKETYFLMHPVYSKDYVLSIKPKHRKPQTFHDYTGYYAVQALRRSFDLLTGYNTEKMTSDKWLTRFLFLETVAGVPGMVAAALRHMRSLRTMKRDGGWIHTLLEEAENERMHLLTFMNMRQPGLVFRSAVLATQGVFLSLYTFFYALSPKHCHAFVSYLEEEAVKTYTHAIHDLDSGRIPEWKDLKAPPLALKYWRLEEGATMRDVLLAVRADELAHNVVNATLAGMKADDTNPFAKGTHIVQE